MTRPSARLVLRTLLPLCFLVALPLPGAAQRDLNRSGYSLSPGDRIEIELYTDAGVELSVVGGERTVDEAGDVFLPFVGSLRGVKATGFPMFVRFGFRKIRNAGTLEIGVMPKTSLKGSIFLLRR